MNGETISATMTALIIAGVLGGQLLGGLLILWGAGERLPINRRRRKP